MGTKFMKILSQLCDDDNELPASDHLLPHEECHKLATTDITFDYICCCFCCWCCHRHGCSRCWCCISIPKSWLGIFHNFYLLQSLVRTAITTTATDITAAWFTTTSFAEEHGAESRRGNDAWCTLFDTCWFEIEFTAFLLTKRLFLEIAGWCWVVAELDVAACSVVVGVDRQRTTFREI